MHIFEPISLKSSYNKGYFGHTFYVQQLSPENRAHYVIMWKNYIRLDRLQMTI